MTPPRVTAGTDVDHVTPLAAGGADDESNFQTLCSEHHQNKSNADKGHRIKLTIALDGWPIETSYSKRNAKA